MSDNWVGGLQNRCGVDTPEEALELAKLISEASSLKFVGIQAYHGTERANENPNWKENTRVHKHTYTYIYVLCVSIWAVLSSSSFSLFFFSLL